MVTQRLHEQLVTVHPGLPRQRRFAKYHDEGFMEGVNPKLEWVGHIEKDGSKGLARGDEHPCVFKLKLNN